ncbi:MAG: DUF2332 domain-containing protein [Pararhodobacter sp.]
MTAPLALAFARQQRACAELGSPFMARLCGILAARLKPECPLTRRLFDWPGDPGPSGESLPLRLAGALHALRLQGHEGLGAVYPPQGADDARLWQAVHAALRDDGAFIGRFIDSAPQTNEVRRSAALIAAGHWLAARYALPIDMLELGASAGLNLLWDRYALRIDGMRLGPQAPALTLTPEWRGPLPPPAAPRIMARAGVDLNPIDVRDPAQCQRLLAYLWPDQPERLALTRAAIAAGPPLPARADAIGWLGAQLTPVPGRLRLIYHTIAWQYFPATARHEGTALIEAAGRHADERAPLAWLAYEADDTSKPGAALALRLWPGDLRLALGRVDFHGRWIDWQAPAA